MNKMIIIDKYKIWSFKSPIYNVSYKIMVKCEWFIMFILGIVWGHNYLQKKLNQ